MAYVAETVGARPIEFVDGAGEVMKGVANAATIYATQQKAEAIKSELETARLKQDTMKAAITLDYIDKIRNSPSPTVQKILQKQYIPQHEKMYGQPIDEDTLKAVMQTPDFNETLDNLIKGMGIDGAGEKYAKLINGLARSLELPYIDSVKQMKTIMDYYLEEKKAAEMAKAAEARADLANQRFGLQTQKFELTENRATSSELDKIENNTEVKNYRTQIVGAGKGLGLILKGKDRYAKTAGRETITWGQLAEAITDMAALQAVKPGAVIPIGREKSIAVDLPAINKFISKIQTNMNQEPDKGVPIGVLKTMEDQFVNIRKLLMLAYEKELKTGYSRALDSKLITPEIGAKRLPEQVKKMDDTLSEFAVEIGVKIPPKYFGQYGFSKGQPKSVSQLIQEGKSREEILEMLPPEKRSLLTVEKYNQAKAQVKQNNTGGK